MAYFHFGSDNIRRKGWSLLVGVFKRPRPESIGLLFRLTVLLHFSPARPFVDLFIMTCPAWQDEPTAYAEYRRTMKPYRYQAVRR